MIPAQRKRHFWTWLIMAILLPILFFLALSVLPKNAYQEKLYQEASPKLENTTDQKR